VRQRLRAEPVARLKRCAVPQSQGRQLGAAFVGGVKQRVVDLDGSGAALDLRVVLLEILAGPAVGQGRVRTQQEDCRDQAKRKMKSGDRTRLHIELLAAQEWGRQQMNISDDPPVQG
jgi:hypothetical protein